MPKSKSKDQTAHLTARPTKAVAPALTEPELTPWFPASVRPTRVGKYEVRQAGILGKGEWDGRVWITDRWLMFDSWGDQWRGLSANPARSGNK